MNKKKKINVAPQTTFEPKNQNNQKKITEMSADKAIKNIKIDLKETNQKPSKMMFSNYKFNSPSNKPRNTISPLSKK